MGEKSKKPKGDQNVYLKKKSNLSLYIISVLFCTCKFENIVLY
jgi:hypothetical protein